MSEPGFQSVQANKIATAAWFLRRPYTYPHLAELVRRSLSPAAQRLENTGADAAAWGEERMLSTQAALGRLLGAREYAPVPQLHPSAIDAANARVRESGLELGGAANLELLYHLVRGTRATRAIETGVAYGWSSLAILLAQEAIGEGVLFSTDMPYPRANNEAHVGCAVPESLRSSWSLIRRPDRSGLQRALVELREIDFAHYDSDKTYAGQSWGLKQIWSALRPGGVLIVDDIQYQTAFRDFSATSGAQPIVVDGGGKLIGVLQKPGALAAQE